MNQPYKLFMFGMVAVAAIFWTNFLPSNAIAQDREKAIRIVAFGDSLSAGYQVAADEAFPAQLQIALDQAGINAIVDNASVSGDTTSGGLSRLDWSLGTNEIDLVVLELGANDALRGIPVELTRQNLDAMIVQLKAKSITPLLAGMLAPPNMGVEYGDAFNSIYPDLAEKHEVALYPFFLDGVAADPSLNQADGIHPTAEGIGIVVSRMLPVLIKTLVSAGHCGTAEEAICDAKHF